MSKSTLIDAFLKLQETKHSNIFEAAKKIKRKCESCDKMECECGSMKEENLDEKLIGNQKKLDKNHNNKLDSQDFKMLRGEKKVEEAAKPDYIDIDKDGDEKESMKKAAKEAKAKKIKDYRADRDKHGEMEEEVELDERNMENKAKKDAAVQKIGSQNKDDQHLGSRGMRTNVADKIRGREVTQGQDRKQYREEVVDEATDPRDSRREYERPNNSLNTAWDKLSTRLPSNPKGSKNAKAGQQSGLKSNIKRDLGSHGPKGKLPEEVEFSEEELAHFEAVIARKDQKGKERGIGDTVDSADLTDEYINEMAQRGVKAGTKRGSYKKKATDLAGNRAASADVGGDEGSKGIPHVLDQIRHGHEDEHGYKTITHPASSPEAPVTKRIHRSELHGFYDRYHNTEKPAAKEKEYSSFLGKHFGDSRSSAPTTKSVTTDLSKIEKSNLKGGGAKPSLGGSKLVGGNK